MFNINLFISSVQVLIPFEESIRHKKATLPALRLDDVMQVALGSLEYKMDILWQIRNNTYQDSFGPDKYYYLDKSHVTGVEEVIMDEDIEYVEKSYIDYTGTLKCSSKIIYDIFNTPIFLS